MLAIQRDESPQASLVQPPVSEAEMERARKSQNMLKGTVNPTCSRSWMGSSK